MFLPDIYTPCFFPGGCTSQFFMGSEPYVYPEVCTPHFFLPCLLQALPIGVCLTRPSLSQGVDACHLSW